VYTSRSGRATVTAGIKGDTIIVTALCDSLQQVIYTLEEELTNTRREVMRQEKKMTESSLRYFLYGLLAGALLAAIIIFLLIKTGK
jgi:hypothetical protein